MPSFAQAWPEIEAVLTGRPSAPPGRADDDAFGAMLRYLFEASMDSRKAASAVDSMREAGLLNPAELAGADLRDLMEHLRELKSPLGPKALRPAMRLAAWVVERGGDAEALREVSTDSLREELRAVNGVGSVSADTILLYGLGHATYPVDRGTYRILARHGWVETTADYDETREIVTGAVGDEPETLIRLSAGMERIAKQFCKLSEPKCEKCPLRPWLPESGPVEG